MSQNAADFLRGGTMCLSKAGLAEGTNANTFQISAPNGAGVDYAIDGVLYHKADADNLGFSAGHAAQKDDTVCLYLVQLDSSGNVSTKQGEIVDLADLVAGNKVLHWPVADDGKCPIGAIKVKNESGSDWTAGSTDLGAANVTDTYYDFVMLPTEPLTS